MTKQMSRLDEIMDAWDDIEDGEPDISTERLIATTISVSECSHGELMIALQRQKFGMKLAKRKIN